MPWLSEIKEQEKKKEVKKAEPKKVEVKSSSNIADNYERPTPYEELVKPKSKPFPWGTLIVGIIVICAFVFMIRGGCSALSQEPYQVEGTIYSMTYEKPRIESGQQIPAKYYINLTFEIKSGETKTLKWETNAEEFSKYKIGDKVTVNIK